ncbi:MAG: hypothetical protein MR673_08885 [Fusobacterium perfoetens]|uniref:hypothetical protein n=1 Tax=Fusobacterium perfoetens TaxID=852 RepID=UPI0023F4D613|nr:hypothetical protein [Fusobacterium perfoetens]MCI6153223.1 hypothetical protein [Fusobacterium perfoetens]MDY3238324.1 hypothetical protein [Fusobacterium perfoetens]
MSMETNLKYMKDEYKMEVEKLARLEEFVKGKEFEEKTNDIQKRIIKEKLELLKQYIAKLKEQIEYDEALLKDKVCYASEDGSYDELEGACVEEKPEIKINAL